MSYTTEISMDFGALTGLTLNAKLYDSAGVQTGATITTGFVEIGNGIYSYLATIPDGHVGTFVAYKSTDATKKVAASINPQELEYSDVKTTSRLAPTTAGRTLAVDTNNKAPATIGAGDYTGNTPQTGDNYALANGANGFVAIKGDAASAASQAGTAAATASTIQILLGVPSDTLANDITAVSGNVWTNGTRTLTNLPGIPDNWITALGIASDAFTSGKFHTSATEEIANAVYTVPNGVALLSFLSTFGDMEVDGVYTALALANAPAGGGGTGDATVANQQTIIELIQAK